MFYPTLLSQFHNVFYSKCVSLAAFVYSYTVWGVTTKAMSFSQAKDKEEVHLMFEMLRMYSKQLRKCHTISGITT